MKTRFPQQRNTYRNSDLRHSLKRKNHGNFKEPNQKKFRDKQYIIRAICSDEICKETAEQAKSLEIKLEVAQRRIEVRFLATDDY